MIRVSVIANDSLIVDSIASILSQEIGLDVLQLTYGLSRNVNEHILHHRSVMIAIDDGETDTGSIHVPYSCRNDGPHLLMYTSLKAINLHLYQSYRLTDDPMEQVAQLVKDFSRTYLRRIHSESVTWQSNQRSLFSHHDLLLPGELIRP